MTIVQKSDINPWRYPPTFDFQYGEWLRDDFEQGHTEPWDSKVMPDLAVLIPQILMRSKTLWGDAPDQTLCPVPYTDFIKAITDSLPHLMKDIDHDTRNVLLTLARIWSTVETDTIRSKPKAADWVTHKLPEQYRPIMERAKSICIGTKPEHWDDIKDLIKPCADFMLEQANHKITKIMPSDTPNKFITLA